jgi:hypothetical protein
VPLNLFDVNPEYSGFLLRVALSKARQRDVEGLNTETAAVKPRVGIE